MSEESHNKVSQEASITNKLNLSIQIQPLGLISTSTKEPSSQYKPAGNAWKQAMNSAQNIYSIILRYCVSSQVNHQHESITMHSTKHQHEHNITITGHSSTGSRQITAKSSSQKKHHDKLIHKEALNQHQLSAQAQNTEHSHDISTQHAGYLACWSGAVILTKSALSSRTAGIISSSKPSFRNFFKGQLA